MFQNMAPSGSFSLSLSGDRKTTFRAAYLRARMESGALGGRIRLNF